MVLLTNLVNMYIWQTCIRDGYMNVRDMCNTPTKTFLSVSRVTQPLNYRQDSCRKAFNWRCTSKGYDQRHWRRPYEDNDMDSSQIFVPDSPMSWCEVKFGWRPVENVCRLIPRDVNSASINILFGHYWTSTMTWLLTLESTTHCQRRQISDWHTNLSETANSADRN
jgi:hypothetical protein